MPWKIVRRQASGIFPGLSAAFLVAALEFAAIGHVAAGITLPPLTLDPQQSDDASLQRPCRYSGDFTQERQLEELSAPLVSTGSFMFSCDEGLLWEVRKPIFDARVYTTEKLNFRVRKNRNVTQLAGIADAKTASLLLDLMSGNTSALSEEFDLASGGETSDSLVLKPKKRSVQKRLTQIIVEQQGDTINITMQAPDTGDYIITINNINLFDGDDLATCRQFSQLAFPACRVLINPDEFALSGFDSSR